MFDKNKLQELNFQNLISVSPLLKNIEYFIFYGTLLGIIRENNIIKGDDDIDFLVNHKFKKTLLGSICDIYVWINSSNNCFIAKNME